MITRRVPTCLRLVRNHSRISRSRGNGWSNVRFASTSANAVPMTTVQSPTSQLAVITNELDKLTPRFDVSAESIEILRNPSEFYTALKVKTHGCVRNLGTVYLSQPCRLGFEMPNDGSFCRRCILAKANTNW
jgi:CDP-diacylglycerol--glycerol-3-phosphate 3-phosphatidyltransferase